jgi:MoxR-like ATPase
VSAFPPAVVESAKRKLVAIREEMNRLFLERAELIDGALCALLSASHVLIIGPPGTAKSMLADELCRRVEGAVYFQWLLTKFTTPEELFGAVSLKGLEEDDYRRVTTGKLPEAHIAFLDEIFKANSSILNALLAIINERIFFNGRHRLAVPLVALFAASNELPEEDELVALYDRFMLRFVVDYIEEEFRFLKMLEGPRSESRTALTFAEFQTLCALAATVEVPGAALAVVARMRRELKKLGLTVSDRRWRNCLAIVRAHALLSGRLSAADDDLCFLEHALWKDPGERERVRQTLRAIVRRHEDEARALLIESQELADYAARAWADQTLKDRALVEAHTKLRQIMARFDALVREAAENPDGLAQVRAMREQAAAIQQQMLKRL